MTKYEWDRSIYPHMMINDRLLKDAVSRRKWQLFTCVIARQVWQLLPEVCKAAVELAECQVDNEQVLSQFALADVQKIRDDNRVDSLFWHVADIACCTLLDYKVHDFRFARIPQYGDVVSRTLQCIILRDVIAWQKVEVKKNAQNYDLALGVYNHPNEGGLLDRDRLAILCDSLKETLENGTMCRSTNIRYVRAFRHPDFWECVTCKTQTREHPKYCRNEITHPILTHFQSSSAHFRGCWAIDALIGKE